MNADIVLTPYELTSKMIAEINFNSFENVLSLTMCDAACKDTTFIDEYINKIVSIVDLDKKRYSEYNFQNNLAIQQYVLLNCVSAYCIVSDEVIEQEIKTILAFKYGVSVNQINNIIKCNIIDDDMPKKKFDIAVLNPPYGTLAKKFLLKSFEIAKESLSVAPSTWLVSTSKDKDLTEVLNNRGGIVESINGMEFFDADIKGSMAITYINNSGKIIVDNNIYNDCSEVMLRSNDNYMILFDNSIKSLYNNDNLMNHLKGTKFAKYKKFIVSDVSDDTWCLKIPRIIGQIYKKTGLYMPNFFTLISRNNKVINQSLGTFKDIRDNKDARKRFEFYFSFNSKQEAFNMFNYIRTDFARTSLYLVKKNLEVIGGGELNYVPWFDFSQEIFSHTPAEIDDYLFKKYNISDEIRKHIEEILPDYYNIRNKK